MTEIPDFEVLPVVGTDEEIYRNAPKMFDIEVVVPGQLTGDVVIELEAASNAPEVKKNVFTRKKA